MFRSLQGRRARSLERPVAAGEEHESASTGPCLLVSYSGSEMIDCPSALKYYFS